MTKTIKWFPNSPDASSPACVCSLCGAQIAYDDGPVRFYCAGEEARFHLGCFSEMIYVGESLEQFTQRLRDAKGD